MSGHVLNCGVLHSARGAGVVVGLPGSRVIPPDVRDVLVAGTSGEADCGDTDSHGVATDK